MSRIGKKPVPLPAGVTAVVQGSRATVKGPKGEMVFNIPAPVSAAVVAGRIEVRCGDDEKRSRALYGTTRNLLANMVEGVTKGYAKDLEIQGVGFRATLQGRQLTLALGYSHPIVFTVPEGIALKVTDSTAINISGVDKQQVGEVAAHIRSFYPAEP
ncbi:MAG: 50S ribosomal protein L6, partial [Kiritimatiellaeota bacterium]|nr:50S ribosomal protein L6 [Kiritimatiellota bacterium]